MRELAQKDLEKFDRIAIVNNFLKPTRKAFAENNLHLAALNGPLAGHYSYFTDSQHGEKPTILLKLASNFGFQTLYIHRLN